MRNYDNVVILNNKQTRRYMKLKSYAKFACQVIGTMGAILMIGTAGASDAEIISFAQCLIQGGIGSVLTIGCYLIYGKLS